MHHFASCRFGCPIIRLNRALIDCARRSPQPYTRSPSALAVRTACGREVAGAYLENAAFNPSIPPWKVQRPFLDTRAS